MNTAALVASGLLFLAQPKIRLHFDSDLAGAAPSFLRFEATSGLPASTWKAIPDAKAITLENVAVQTGKSGSPGQYRFALSTEAKDFLDGKAGVSIRRKGPKNPCRGGLAVRYRDPQNFLGVFWDFEKADVSLLDVRKGKATTLGTARIESNEPLWRTIEVELSGPRVAVRVSQKAALEASDPDPVRGAAGLLAEGDSIVAFDELVIEPK